MRRWGAAREPFAVKCLMYTVLCLALEMLAERHKVAMCQARVVGQLIAMSHSRDPELMDCAGTVLKLLA